MKTTNKNSKTTPQKNSQEIDRTLSSFSVITNRTLKWLFDGVPLAVVASTAVMTYAGIYSKTGVDLLYLTGGLTIVISILNTRTMFNQFPQLLLMLWRRKVLRPRELHKNSPQALEESFLEFVQMIPYKLNNKLGILIGVFGTIIISWTIWLLDTEILQEIYLNFRNPFSWYGVMALVRLSFLAAGFIGGITGWQILVIADTVSKLGKRFDFDLQINHPDGCGGLGPIGDLCLKLAYIISPFPILIGLWLVFINFFDIRYLRMLPENLVPLASTLVFLIIPTTAICIFSFFLPLGAVHTAMLREKSKLQTELDSISQEIHQLSSDLLSKANSLDPQQGVSLEEKIEFLKRVYTRNSQIPTWPYRSTHIWGLVSTQVIPAMGVISSIVGLIKDFR